MTKGEYDFFYSILRCAIKRKHSYMIPQKGVVVIECFIENQSNMFDWYTNSYGVYRFYKGGKCIGQIEIIDI